MMNPPSSHPYPSTPPPPNAPAGAQPLRTSLDALREQIAAHRETLRRGR